MSRRSLVVVGAGPRGTGFLERLAANLPELYGDRALDVHLVDPYPPGPGRIWRAAQSPLLWMNSRAEDVTSFTDATVPLEGPVVPGPSHAEWATGSDGRDFPTRARQGGYLRWAYERARAALPPTVTLHEHPTTALRVGGPQDGRQRVWLAGRTEPLTADLVVLTLGHLDARPDPEARALGAFADRHGLVHLPPGFTADTDLSVLPAGEPVLVRGFGLAFVDLMVLLTQGRGGRYEEAADGRLRYLASGREPVLYVGSRRGVPYHAKIDYRADGEQPPPPRFFGPAQVDPLLARVHGGERLDFRREVWPLIARELGWAHYHRLFTAHPERTALTWAEFAEAYGASADASGGTSDEASGGAGGFGADLDALVAAAVPDPADRFDPADLDRPLAGVSYGSFDALQHGLRRHIADDLERRHDPAHSADLAVQGALLRVYGQLARFPDPGDGDTWWHGFFSFLASGPPGPRLRGLLALSEAGIVRFLGAGLTVGADEERGVFRAVSSSLPGHVTEARALVEARLPDPTVTRSASPLLRGLYEDGARATGAGLLAVDPGDGRLIGRDGRPHPRRFALGPHTTARAGGAFTRPRTGGLAFAQNDRAARTALGLLRDLDGRALPGADAVATPLSA
ncbi:FAD/NAD(P)-binding protein [Streptomyces sp. NPDC090025]|uniref:FAD/NAD(P)-binding protein n=1 Tax=Streptomyces sp. NPDC090025 TaxID=3365922 RepID=UPI00383520AF